VPLSNFAPRGFAFVHHSIAILYHQVPNPNITIRNFFIAVRRKGRCCWRLERIAAFPHASAEEARALAEVWLAEGPWAAVGALSLHVYNATVACPTLAGLLPSKPPAILCHL
jgi:hypothetical protein